MMANQSYPNNLPDEQFLPITLNRQDARVRTEMDQGPAKQRRRFTAAVQPVNVTFRFTGEELDTFYDFYVNTLKEGALRFNWENPRTGNTVEMRFAEEGFPEFENIRGGQGDSGLWQGQAQLEIMP